MDASRAVEPRDDSYSPDVELDHEGRLVYTRDIKVGEVIQIPAHMMGKFRETALLKR